MALHNFHLFSFRVFCLMMLTSGAKKFALEYILFLFINSIVGGLCIKPETLHNPPIFL